MSDVPPRQQANSVTLQRVTAENKAAVVALRVRPGQERLVASNAQSLADARAVPACKPFAVYAGAAPVGFLMLRHDYPRPLDYSLLRLMIAAEHQGRGYGTAALGRLVAHVRTLPGATALRTSYDVGEGNAGPFYARLDERGRGGAAPAPLSRRGSRSVRSGRPALQGSGGALGGAGPPGAAGYSRGVDRLPELLSLGT